MPHRTPDSALAALQRRQLGVATRRQAVACGVADSTISGRVRAGRYLTLWPGVFADAATPTSWEQRAVAAVLHVGGEAALARSSAARLLGLDERTGADAVHVVVRDRVFPRTRGITVHRTRQLPPCDTVLRHGVAVTGGVRTTADLAGSSHPAALRRLLARGVRLGVVDPSELRGHLRRRGRLRGKVLLGELLDELSPLAAACRSELESEFLHVTRRHGVAPDAMNHPVRDADGHRRYLDGAWLLERQPVELDSRLHHGTLLDWHDDLRRENAVTLVGWRTPLRFTWDDVTRRPHDMVATIRRALAAARTDPRPPLPVE